jgi:hypothetical protein
VTVRLGYYQNHQKPPTVPLTELVQEVLIQEVLVANKETTMAKKPKPAEPDMSGLKAAILNQTQHRVSAIPWSRPDNERCLIKDCNKKVYLHSEIYYSLCKTCLQDKELGPFRKR